MDIKTLKNFVTVAENGSILKAANELHISQPPLSKQMQALEKELGVTLFERTSRGIRLTVKGELLYKKALSLISYSESILTELQQPAADTINIGIVTSATDFTLSLMDSFCRTRDVKFSIYEKDSFEHIKMLEKGLLDVALVRSPFEVSADINAVKILDDNLTVVGKSEFFSSESSLTAPGALEEIPLIITRRWHNHISKHWPETAEKLYFRYICEDNHTALSLAERSAGAAIVPGTTAQAKITDPDFKVINFTDEKLQTGLYLLYSRKFAATGAVSDFITYILAQK